MRCYVHDNHFNFREREPQVVLADGTTAPFTYYAPLQSDITTLISSLLAILRLITAAWLGPLWWRCAFILMAKTGLKPWQLHTIVSYGIPTLHMPEGGGRDVDLLIRPISIILAIVLPVHLVAPVLTGSITWTPYNRPVGQPSNSVIAVTAMGEGQWSDWNRYLSRRERTCVTAAGLANVAWGRDSQNSPEILKRVLPSAAQLEMNSTITNVTLPYFSVSKIEWIKDPGSTLTSDQLTLDQACSKVTLYPGGECPLVKEWNTVALVPDEPAIWTNRSFPSPSYVSETRLMRHYTHWKQSGDCPPPIDPSLSDINTHRDTWDICYAYAWVTYTAGVSVCNRCRISSFATVQNDGDLGVEEDPMTREALLMMPTVISMIGLMGNGSPSSYRGNLTEHVVTLLTRSYTASWTALTNFMGEHSPSLTTTYSAALPVSRALVDLKRVYLWLVIQFLITASGILFIWVQIRTRDPIIEDTTLAAFYLDSSDVYHRGNRDRLKSGALLKLQGDGRLVVEDNRQGYKVIAG